LSDPPGTPNSISITLVPFAYTNFCPLLTAVNVGPVPETVFTSTVKAPTVPFSKT
jgi:hypothetical protein